MTANDLKFLKGLARNNDRDWFQKNRPLFDTAQTNFLGLVTGLIYAISDYDESIAGIDPKSCVFRIYRDVRFSKNKAPYKNHLGAYICAGGKKSTNLPGYYIHIEPGGNSIFGSGFYMPEKTILQSLREDIIRPKSRIVTMLADRTFRKYFADLVEDDKAKTVPRGFEKNHPQADLLKQKHMFIYSHFTDAEIIKANFLNTLAARGQKLHQWNQMLLDCSR